MRAQCFSQKQYIFLDISLKRIKYLLGFKSYYGEYVNICLIVFVMMFVFFLSGDQVFLVKFLGLRVSLMRMAARRQKISQTVKNIPQNKPIFHLGHSIHWFFFVLFLSGSPFFPGDFPDFWAVCYANQSVKACLGLAVLCFWFCFLSQWILLSPPQIELIGLSRQRFMTLKCK